MAEIRFLYVTAPDGETAKLIALRLIAEKLAACVNLHAPMRSIYEWEGNLEENAEIPLIVKTTAAAAPAARDRIIDLHPHETPCIAALKIDADGSSPGFLAWVAAATNP